jgi:pimeloyl-ACP methyl ester carboxylesterase
VVRFSRAARPRLTPALRTRRAVLASEQILPELNGLTPPWPGRAVRLDGKVTFVRHTPATRPAAPAALYVHGLGGSSTNWTDLAALLAGFLDADAIDLPGAGQSDPAGRYTIAALADRVIRWIEYAGRGPVHLLGNSLGGTVTVKVAALRPDLVRTLTLISPALPFLDPRRSLESRVIPLATLPWGDRVVRRVLAGIPPEELVRQVMEACFADPSCVPEQRIAEAVEEVRQRYTLDHYGSAYLRTLRGLVTAFLRAYLPGHGSLWRAAAAVRAPTLVIGGRLDRLVDVRVAPRAAWLVPDSRLLMLDRAGHVAHMETPRVVARAVVALLQEVMDGSFDVGEAAGVAD